MAASAPAKSFPMCHALATVESGLTLACTGLKGAGELAEARVHHAHIDLYQTGQEAVCAI